MPDKAKVAVMLSGTGTTMSSLLFHSRLPDCPYEIVLVASNVPEALGLRIAEAEGIPIFAHSHKGMEREAHEAVSRIGEVIEGPRGCTVRGSAGTWSAKADWEARHDA